MNQVKWPPHFDLDRQHILDLLTGDRFYSDADAALREAILNSIDACGRRKATEPKLLPRIEVSFNRSSQTVSVTDNGDGMDKEEISNLFLKIGASAANVASQAGQGNYKAIGEFGIGVVSYFLVCDRFEVHTRKSDKEALGLELTRSMLDATTPAKEITAQQDTRGTRLILFLKEERFFDLLLKRFPHWARDVNGLTAVIEPDGTTIDQGGRSDQIQRITIGETPDWVEECLLGSPTNLDIWDALDGRARIAILYRGVFVQSVELQGLWGIGGSIYVDPKRFRPKLNRESFIAEGFSEEVTRFIQSVHPKALLEAIRFIERSMKEKTMSEWTHYKWATLWLAVPRTGLYAEVAETWDEVFRNREAFRLLQGDNEKIVSLAELQKIGKPVLYLAPADLRSSSVLIRHAVNVLRALGEPVVQGISRDPGGYLKYASFALGSATDSLLSYFADSLPEIKMVGSVAHEVIRRAQSVEELFMTNPKVLIFRLGDEASPVARVEEEIWVNADSPAGREIVKEVCNRNEGHLGLLVACQKHSPSIIPEITPLLKNLDNEPQLLGPARRQYLKIIAS